MKVQDMMNVMGIMPGDVMLLCNNKRDRIIFLGEYGTMPREMKELPFFGLEWTPGGLIVHANVE